MTKNFMSSAIWKEKFVTLLTNSFHSNNRGFTNESHDKFAFIYILEKIAHSVISLLQ